MGGWSTLTTAHPQIFFSVSSIAFSSRGYPPIASSISSIASLTSSPADFKSSLVASGSLPVATFTTSATTATGVNAVLTAALIMFEYVSLVNNPMHMISDRLTMVQQGSDKKYMNERGLVKCKAKDASGLMYVSKWDAERNDWISISHTYVKSSAN